MSDLDTQAPDEIQDTPPAAPEVEDTQPVVDYEQRYTSLRPEYDRKSQRLAELEAEREQWLASQQEPEDDDTEYEYEYEDPVARREIADLKAQLQAERQEQDTLRQQADEREYVTNEIQALEKELGEEFDDDDFDFIGQLSERTRDEHGNPDVRAVYARLAKRDERKKGSYVKTKKAPTVQSGPPAAEIPDLDTPQKRAEYWEKRAAEEDASF